MCIRDRFLYTVSRRVGMAQQRKSFRPPVKAEQRQVVLDILYGKILQKVKAERIVRSVLIILRKFYMAKRIPVRAAVGNIIIIEIRIALSLIHI